MVVIFGVSTLSAQAMGNNEGDENGTEEVVVEIPAEEEAVESDEFVELESLGNFLTIQAGMVYSVPSNPFTRLAIGYDFALNPRFMLGANIGLLNKQNTGEDGGGESTFSFWSAQLRFLVGRFYMTHGYSYQTLTSGYVVDETDQFEALTRSDVPDQLGINFGFGYYADVAENLRLMPELTLGYNLPTSAGAGFNPADVSIGINLGLGFDPGRR